MDLQCRMFHKIVHYTDYRYGKPLPEIDMCTRCDLDQIKKAVGWDTLSWVVHPREGI